MTNEWDTSREARKKNRHRGQETQVKILEILERQMPLERGHSCEELVEAIKAENPELRPHILNIRPIVSKLVKAGVLEDAGRRAPTELGNNAVCWKLTRRQT